MRMLRPATRRLRVAASSQAAPTQSAGKVTTGSQHPAALVAEEHSRGRAGPSPRRSGKSSDDPEMMVLADAHDGPVSGNPLETPSIVLKQRFKTSGLVPAAAFLLFSSNERAESLTAPDLRTSQGPVSACSRRTGPCCGVWSRLSKGALRFSSGEEPGSVSVAASDAYLGPQISCSSKKALPETAPDRHRFLAPIEPCFC